MIDVEDLKRRAGCTSRCAVDVSHNDLRLAWRVQHNGVRFSRATDIDDVLVRGSLDAELDRLHAVLGAWMAGHHHGDTSDPFRYEFDPGQVILVPESQSW